MLVQIFRFGMPVFPHSNFIASTGGAFSFVSFPRMQKRRTLLNKHVLLNKHLKLFVKKLSLPGQPDAMVREALLKG